MSAIFQESQPISELAINTLSINLVAAAEATVVPDTEAVAEGSNVNVTIASLFETTVPAADINIDKIKITSHDEENQLSIHHYLHCSSESEEWIKEYRGIVVHHSSGSKKDIELKISDSESVVCKTFGFTPEFTTSQRDAIEKHLPSSLFQEKTGDTILKAMSYNSSPLEENLTIARFYDSEEGALIRLFKFNNRWHISTHKKLDAFKSRWGCMESFGDMFIDALVYETEHGSLKDIIKVEDTEDIFDAFTATLNPSLNYTFLVRNTINNRIVCQAPAVPTIYFTGAFDKGTHRYIDINDTGIQRPNEVKFTSLTELLEYVNNLDSNDKQGIIVYIMNFGNAEEGNDIKQIKILNPNYIKFSAIRGNDPNLKFRYLQLRQNCDVTNHGELSLLYQMYPEHNDMFRDCEDTLEKIVIKITNDYRSRYINHDFVVAPRTHFKIMNKIHEWHKSDRANNRISVDIVCELVDSSDASTLNDLIREYNDEENNIPNVAPHSSTTAHLSTVAHPSRSHGKTEKKWRPIRQQAQSSKFLDAVKKSIRTE